MKKIFLSATLAMLFGTQVALAHVTLEVPKAEASASYKAVFRVAHACTAGGVTTALSVAVPDGVSNVKPMPKAGWTISLKQAKLTQPLLVHGRSISHVVQEVTWTAASKEAALRDEQYDEFTLRVTLPDQAGNLWWKSVQTCESGQSRWVEVPAKGVSTKGLAMPAALLEVLEIPAEVTQSPTVHAH